MEERRINNILDNLDDNTKTLMEIRACLGEIKVRICGEMPLCQELKVSEGKEATNTLGFKVGNQGGIIADILEEARRIFNKV